MHALEHGNWRQAMALLRADGSSQHALAAVIRLLADRYQWAALPCFPSAVKWSASSVRTKCKMPSGEEAVSRELRLVI